MSAFLYSGARNSSSRSSSGGAEIGEFSFGSEVLKGGIGVYALFTFGYYAWVHEGGQCEVGDNEEGDNALVREYPWKSGQVELASGRENVCKFPKPRRIFMEFSAGYQLIARRAAQYV